MWYYNNKWMVYGVLAQLLYKLNAAVRTTKQQRKAMPSLVIIDSQSVKTTAGVSQLNGYDVNKKVKGIDKRNRVKEKSISCVAAIL